MSHPRGGDRVLYMRARWKDGARVRTVGIVVRDIDAFVHAPGERLIAVEIASARGKDRAFMVSKESLSCFVVDC